MRFFLRTAFWLGLTFHAMPWGDMKLSDALPAATPALVSLAAASANSEAAGGLVTLALRGALDPATQPAAEPLRGSMDTLSADDRAAPWRGPPAKPLR